MAKTKIHGEYLDPSVISGQTQVTAVGADSMLIFDATDNALKKALLSDLIETVGSTPTFSQISSTGNLTIDAAGDIILDADGDDWKFHEGGNSVFEIKHESHGVDFLLNTSDEDWRFKGSDGGSTITALHLDISEGGKAIFNAGAAFGSDVGIGTTSPQSGLHIAEGGSGSDGGSVLTLSQTGFGSIVNNDDLGSVHFGGVTGGGVGIHKSAIIMAEGDATWANNDYPTRLTFHTTADGASSATERMRIDSSGNLLVGATSFNAGSFGGSARGINVAGAQPFALFHETDTDKDGYIGVASSMMFIQTADAIPIRFGTSDTERMRILSGGGLTFNGDTAAANALDDYEEGTWTPVPKFGSTSGSTVSASGQYTKVGSFVNAVCFFGISATNGSGDFTITGLPFAADNITAISIRPHNTSYSGMMVGDINGGTTTIRMYEATEAGALNEITNGNVTTTAYFSISTSYFTNA